MFSIGEISAQVGIKVPTIRYYEKIGLMPDPDRSHGNQRRYSQAALDKLSFIKHARDLGFSLKSISNLIDLSGLQEGSCNQIDKLAKDHLDQVRMKLRMLKKLESELMRMVSGCNAGEIKECYVIESLARHDFCFGEHSR